MRRGTGWRVGKLRPPWNWLAIVLILLVMVAFLVRRLR